MSVVVHSRDTTKRRRSTATGTEQRDDFVPAESRGSWQTQGFATGAILRR
jgi:hypothetical protein